MQRSDDFVLLVGVSAALRLYERNSRTRATVRRSLLLDMNDTVDGHAATKPLVKSRLSGIWANYSNPQIPTAKLISCSTAVPKTKDLGLSPRGHLSA